MKTPSSILKETFGYDDFLPLQKDVIENVLAGRDTLSVMPTGGGKSLCYQIPALLLDGLTLVVSPLISLMKDQVEQLRANGVPALFLNSSLSAEAYRENMEYIRNGSVKLLYVAPETLLTPRIQTLVSSLKLSLLTIDEAHCISEWGHDFRPEYRQLVNIRQRFPQAVCLALTATATPRVRKDIKTSLNFLESNEFVASFNRENLFIEVNPKDEPLSQTLSFLERFKDQSGIIYCFSRKQVDDLSKYLALKGFSVRPYHAGLEDGERQANQEAFSRDDVQIIVATIAFGMGINKPNVRFIIHFDLPKSIENYYQEIGRAGRDGLPSFCLLLYSYSDVAKLKYFLQQKEGNEKKIATQQLDAIVGYAEAESQCRRKPLLAYFGETFGAENCNTCDNCTRTQANLVDITIPAQKFLSCVKRTGESFGAIHIANVLRGSKAEKVLQNGHDQLSTYGIGTDLDQKQWQHLSRQLLQMGYLKQDDAFRSLSLTPKGLEALKSRTPIQGQFQEAAQSTRSAKDAKTDLEYNHPLFDLLRQKRKELADESGVPPYVIFSDRTLVEFSIYFPQTQESLLTMSGVGQAKLAQYGETFLNVIIPFCKKMGLKGKQKNIPAPKIEIGQRSLLVGEAYNAGQSIQSLMDQYQVQVGTIIAHLERFVLAGNSLRSSDELSSFIPLTADEQKNVLAAFDELGTTYLKPVFDKFNGMINYDVLKIMRLLYMTTHAQTQTSHT
jgi:ATP-dependent DNA helicase RecQ